MKCPDFRGEKCPDRTGYLDLRGANITKCPDFRGEKCPDRTGCPDFRGET